MNAQLAASPRALQVTASPAAPGDLLVKYVKARRRFVIGRVVRVNGYGSVMSFRPFGEPYTIAIRSGEVRFIVSQAEIDVAACERAATRRRSAGFHTLAAARRSLAVHLKEVWC